MTDRKGIGGRKRHGTNLKKSPLNLRTDPELRARVEAFAEANGLSMTRAAETLVRRGLEAGPA
jgi:antitoxin component of RelBE/YafQ-DinJ toxin-antitoxin module